MWEELHVRNILRKGNDFSHYTPAHPPHWSFMFLRRKNKILVGSYWKFEQPHKNFLLEEGFYIRFRTSRYLNTLTDIKIIRCD